jgi:hypothetical protein
MTQTRDNPGAWLMQVTGGEVRKVCRGGPHQNDGNPVICLSRRLVGVRGEKYRPKGNGKERQPHDVAQTNFVGKEVAHVCAEYAGEAQRHPVAAV